MTPSIVVALAALLPHADKATRLKIVLCIVVIITQENCLKRVLAAVPKPFRRGILSSFLMRKAYQAPRSTPSGINRPSVSPIKAMIDGGHETEFRRMFRLSRNVFEALVQDLSPWIKDGRSRNGRQNVEARVKVGIALFYMAHGGDGISLGAISGLKNNSALKYLHEVSAAITIHIAPKWMGPELLNSPGYMEKVRSRFHLHHGFPNVGLCIDGTHIPYTPNSGEHEQKCAFGALVLAAEPSAFAGAVFGLLGLFPLVLPWLTSAGLELVPCELMGTVTANEMEINNQ